MKPVEFETGPATSETKCFAAVRDAFVRGALSPRDYLEGCIAAIEERESSVKAIVSMDLSMARDAADAASQRYREGRPLSLIDGMPIGIKDIINTAHLPTQMNSKMYTGWQPKWDAAPVMALRGAGAIPFAKTVTTEFACGDPGETRNPHDLERSPGGSSSGSAAGVSAGMMPAALGTQTRASLIRPASYCGVFAFKPSYGGLNLAGVHPVSVSLDHLGVIAGSLDDCWIVAIEIANRVGGSGGPGLIGPSKRPDSEKPKRLAVVETDGWSEIGDDVRASFQACLEIVRASGVKVETRTDRSELEAFERDLRGADTCAREITAFELKSPVGSYVEQGVAEFGKTVREYYKLSQSIDRERHLSNLQRCASMKSAFAALRERYDAIITLASSGVAPVGLHDTGSRAFISPWNMIGAPAASLPIIWKEGLPVGVQLVGFPGQDYRCACLANWVSSSVCSQ